MLLLLLVYTLTHKEPQHEEKFASSFREKDPSSHEMKICYPNRGLRPLKDRGEMGILLEEYGLKTGAEVGVQKGLFSNTVLSQWKSCQSYKLIDAWEHQKNYKDGSNVDQETQNKLFENTKALLKKYDNITEYFRMYSTEAAKKIEKASLDFIYIDARHDYCGVTEDLGAYWPLLKPGGIMAGHDYLSAEEARTNKGRGKFDDWSICQDGRKNERAARGAVEDFFLPMGLTITATYWRQESWFSWLVQKPVQCADY